MARKPDVNYKVTPLKKFFFVGTGVLLDIFDFVLGITGIGEVADEIVDVVADIAIPIFAFLLGIPLGGRQAQKRTQAILVAEVAKIIPFVNIIPLYTWETLRLVRLSEEEDEEEALAAQQKDQKSAVASQLQQMRALEIVRQQRLQAANDNEVQEEQMAA